MQEHIKMLDESKKIKIIKAFPTMKIFRQRSKCMQILFSRILQFTNR